jgi:hypothetical protein
MDKLGNNAKVIIGNFFFIILMFIHFLVQSVSVNIVSDRDGFVWKGHDQLTLRSGALTFPQGYQVSSYPRSFTVLAQLLK